MINFIIHKYLKYGITKVLQTDDAAMFAKSLNRENASKAAWWRQNE